MLVCTSAGSRAVTGSIVESLDRPGRRENAMAADTGNAEDVEHKPQRPRQRTEQMRGGMRG
jgi:hypothetical protein